MRRELAGVAFQLSAAAGLIVGLVVGLGRPAAHTWSCARDGRCGGAGLMAGTGQVLVPVAVGLAGGALVGVLVAMAIRSAASVGIGAVAPGGGSTRWIYARFHGVCDSCRAAVAPGDRVRHSRVQRTVICESCARHGSDRLGARSPWP